MWSHNWAASKLDQITTGIQAVSDFTTQQNRPQVKYSTIKLLRSVSPPGPTTRRPFTHAASAVIQWCLPERIPDSDRGGVEGPCLRHRQGDNLPGRYSIEYVPATQPRLCLPPTILRLQGLRSGRHAGVRGKGPDPYSKISTPRPSSPRARASNASLICSSS